MQRNRVYIIVDGCNNFQNITELSDFVRAKLKTILNYPLVEKPLHGLLISTQAEVHNKDFEMCKEP